MQKWQFILLRAFILIACGAGSAWITIALGAFLGIEKAVLVLLALLTGVATVLLLGLIVIGGSVSTRW